MKIKNLWNHHLVFELTPVFFTNMFELFEQVLFHWYFGENLCTPLPWEKLATHSLSPAKLQESHILGWLVVKGAPQLFSAGCRKPIPASQTLKVWSSYKVWATAAEPGGMLETIKPHVFIFLKPTLSESLPSARRRRTRSCWRTGQQNHVPMTPFVQRLGKLQYWRKRSVSWYWRDISKAQERTTLKDVMMWLQI